MDYDQWSRPTSRADVELRRERTGIYLRVKAGASEREMEFKAEGRWASAEGDFSRQGLTPSRYSWVLRPKIAQLRGLQVVGSDHPEIAADPSKLARWAGFAAAARDRYAALVTAIAQVLGTDNSDILVARSDLATWTGEAGDAAAARDQYAALLPKAERVLGADHPETVSIHANLARWTGEAGDAAAARDQYAALMPKAERVFGAHHPGTLVVRNNHAAWIGEAGNAKRARDELAALLPDVERVLGADHLDTLVVRNNYAAWTGEAGNATRARDELAALLPDVERVLGADHLDTVVVQNNLASLEQAGIEQYAQVAEGEAEGGTPPTSSGVTKPEQPESSSRAAPRLFWNTRFPGNEAILSPPHGRRPTVVAGFEYLLATALEQTPAAGVSTEVAEPAGLIGTEVKFRLLGTGVGFALSSADEYAARVESQPLRCEPVGTPAFQVRCRFDRAGPAEIKLRLLAENSRFLDQAIEFHVLGGAPDGNEVAGSDDDMEASRDAAGSAPVAAGRLDVSSVSRPRPTMLHFEVTGAGGLINLECHATGVQGFDQPPIRAVGMRDDIDVAVERCRGALVRLAEKYPGLAKKSAAGTDVPAPWELGAHKDEVLKDFAEIGWELHESLFGFAGQSTDVAKLARSISMVGRDPDDGAVAQIDDDIGLPLPWGLLYDASSYGEVLREQGRDVPDRYTRVPGSADQVDVSCFWGQRFAMFRTRFPRDPLSPEYADQSGGVRVTAVLNRTFGSSIVEEQWAALTGEALGGGSLRLLEEAHISDKQTLLNWVKNGDRSHCDLLYFFCHASVPTRVGFGGYPTALADRWKDALIGLGDEHDRSTSVSLQDLRNWHRRRPRRPLVFLNACGSAQADPLYGNPFVEHFVRDWECRALVGTDWTVPTAFADVFSRKVIARLRLGEALLDALRSVSMEAFAEGNPYPLIYGLYGEPEVQFPRSRHG